MATPPYLGAGQPGASSAGWLGRLGSYFGNGIAPMYQLAPPPKPESSTNEVPMEETSMETICEASAMTCPIDPEALAAGQIAIVIPRRGS